jgi:hypothetical protein
MKIVAEKRYGPVKLFQRAGCILIFLFISCLTVYGQVRRREVPPLKERLFYGGSFGLQFGTYTDIAVSPVMGLWVLPRLNVAVGPDFRYFKFYSYGTTIYGGKVYTELVFLQDLDNIIPLGLHFGLFFHAEDEILSLESAYFRQNPPYESKRFFLNTVLAGGGVRQQLGQRSSMNLTFLWVVNGTDYGVYGNPEIRVSFIF